jgi:autotransporter-associated beta strand protein
MMILTPSDRLVGGLVCAVALLLHPAVSRAAEILKANNSTTLNLGGSWVGGVAPTSADVAKWDSSIASANAGIALGASTNWQGIKITNPTNAITIANTASATLTLGSSGIDMSGAATNLTLACLTYLGSPQTWNVATGRTNTVSGVMGGASLSTLTKEGAGRLGFSAKNSFTNDVIINGGTVACTIARTAPNTALGVLDPNRTVSINSGGILSIDVADVLGGGNDISACPAPLLVVNAGGKLQTTINNGNNFGKITLNGGTFSLGSGQATPKYAAAILTDTITVGGATASTISGNGTPGSVGNLGFNGSTVGVTFNVADATGDANADLIVLAPLWNPANNTTPAANTPSLTKLGGGTLRLSATNGFSGKTVISAGTLALGANGATNGTLISTYVEFGGVATFDVTALPGSSYTFASGKVLTNSVSSGTAIINATGGIVTLAANALLGFSATGGITSTAGTISVTGNLTLNTNAVTVNVTGAPLGAGTYRLLDCTGTLTSAAALPMPNIVGAGVALGSTASLSVTTGGAGHVDLVVTAPWNGTVVLTELSLAGSNLVAAGSNGLANTEYHTLFSTNLTAPRAEWTIIGTNYFDASGNFIVTNDIAGADAGYYRLTIRTPGALTILSQPHDLEGVPGQNLVFSVLAGGAPPLVYQWYFGTNLLLGATNSYLVVTNAQTNLAGSYSAVISNSLGVTTSSIAALTVTATPANQRPRVIATTDGEIDDRSSMVRFLMYASDYDIAGIVQVNSSFQPSGHSSEHWVEAHITNYASCLPNLRIHRPDYADANYLLSVVTAGNEVAGDLNKSPTLLADSPGAQLIISTLLDSDPRPVHILAWGGANTQANALWQIKTNYSAAEYARAAAKTRLYFIWYQDGGGSWIQTNLPEIKIYEAGSPVHDGGWRYVWDYMSVDLKYKGRLSQNPPDIQTIMDTPWLTNNVKLGHGPLTAGYPQDYTSEGDSPSFMPLVDNGLEQDTDYTLGGWGGRPIYVAGNLGNHMQDGEDGTDVYSGTNASHYTFWRWLPAVQNDWAARADWCVVTNYAGANHQPVATVVGGLTREASPGQTVTLDATGSTDPDGNSLAYKWWQYFEADSATNRVTISNSNFMNGANFVVPNEVGKRVHIILEVTDDGTPPLTRYRRVICNIQ